jgi:hypothetical protein
MLAQMVFTIISLCLCPDGIIHVVSLPTQPQHVSAGMGVEKGIMMFWIVLFIHASGVLSADIKLFPLMSYEFFV